MTRLGILKVVFFIHVFQVVVAVYSSHPVNKYRAMLSDNLKYTQVVRVVKQLKVFYVPRGTLKTTE